MLVFIDEVEEIASVRGERPGSGSHGITNELLKLIPGFRERDERLLVCATNSIRSLDPAFLRPGRFDYLVPIGTPDVAARAAIWARYSGGRADVDLDTLVVASELFTPADIEHAARIAAQAAFERDLTTAGQSPEIPAGAGTADYLAAIGQCRPTVTPTMIDEFTADIASHARL
ncbi:AAA family ATPase [Streptosporangium sp. CA-135522]|uniref:AAA family ATPase n=1 Tax=Streptosporangium sp. CA-135522 TaxID=3240072 RepID=UPI003D91AC6E